MKKIALAALCLVLVVVCCSCSNEGKTKLYELKGGKWVAIKTIESENDMDFAVSLTTGGTSFGYTNGTEEPNYRIVFNEGTDSEAVYDLIVDFEVESIAYIAPDLFGEAIEGTGKEVFLSFTSTLDFYDFLP